MKLRKTIPILAAALLICSALLFQVAPVSAATTDVTNEQSLSPQLPPPPPPPPPTPPIPPPPPTPPIPPPPTWYYPKYPTYPYPYTWKYPYACPNVVIIQQPQKPPICCTPVICSFTANPSCVNQCQTVVLNWNVSNAYTVTISPGIGSVSNSGSYSVTPCCTTTYTLTATNSAGSVSASTTVTVAHYVATSSTSVDTQVTITESTAASSTSSISTMGLGNIWNNPPLLIALLIILLAAATAAIVVLARKKPALAHAGQRAGGTLAGYLPWSHPTSDATATPKTMPVSADGAAKFILPDGEQMPISERGGILGRDDFRSLLMPGKTNLISREHIRIYSENGKYYIEDLNSTNGTKVNWSTINGKGKILLSDGDVIVLADVLILIFKT